MLKNSNQFWITATMTYSPRSQQYNLNKNIINIIFAGAYYYYNIFVLLIIKDILSQA